MSLPVNQKYIFCLEDYLTAMLGDAEVDALDGPVCVSHYDKTPQMERLVIFPKGTSGAVMEDIFVDITKNGVGRYFTSVGNEQILAHIRNHRNTSESKRTLGFGNFIFFTPCYMTDEEIDGCVLFFMELQQVARENK